MADVQKEYGYTAQANSYIEALAKIRIPGEANQCLLVIQRKTWGWNKKTDQISLSQFVDGTGICKPHVCRSLKALQKMNMIIVTKKGNGITEYAIQKDFEQWIALPKKVRGKNVLTGRKSIKEFKDEIRKRDSNICQSCGYDGGLTKENLHVHHVDFNQTNNDSSNLITFCKSCHGKSHTNKNITNIGNGNVLPKTVNVITKKGNNPHKIVTQKGTHKTKSKATTTKEYSSVVKFLVEEYFKTLTEPQQARFEKNRDEYHACCDKLMRIDGLSEEEIRKAVNFARNDYFWSQNFLSFSKLRKKDKDGMPYIEVFLNKAGKQKQTEAKVPPGNPPKMTEAEEREYYKVKK